MKIKDEKILISVYIILFFILFSSLLYLFKPRQVLDKDDQIDRTKVVVYSLTLSIFSTLICYIISIKDHSDKIFNKIKSYEFPSPEKLELLAKK